MKNEPLIWVLFGLCLAISFILSGLEAGVFALNRLRIRQQIRAGRYSAKLLYGYLEHPENFLWTLLVGNTLANFVILGWLVVVLYRWFAGRPWWFALVFGITVFLFYTLLDLLPKMLFRKYPDRLCILVARPFRVIHWCLSPAVALVQSVSDMLLRWRGGRSTTPRVFGNREELRVLMQESGQELTSEERAMIARVLDLQSMTVRQALKPLPQTVTLRSDAPAREVLELCRRHKFTRLPIWGNREGEEPRIIGLVSCNDLIFREDLDETRPASEFVRPALFLDEDLRLELALRRMQRAGQRLAIVLNRERRETGIISLQDLLKVVFGEVSL